MRTVPMWSKSICDKIPSNRKLKTIVNARWLLKDFKLKNSFIFLTDRFTSAEITEIVNVGYNKLTDIGSYVIVAKTNPL